MGNLIALSDYYFPMFEQELDKHNLPLEIKYLAVVESALDPVAQSRVGAKGLWQFMFTTGKMYGLEVSSYVDERADPQMATEAASKYLKSLYKSFNDWDLALAAYNAGPGNVNKAIRRSGNKLTYWDVRPFLPRETQGYVPNFIAAAYLLTYYAEHNIIPAEAKISYNQLDTMCLTKGVHMTTISKLIDMEEEEIKRLNPIYKRNYIPKSIPGQCIYLPLEKIGELVSYEDSLYALEYELYIKKGEPKTPQNTGVTTITANNAAYQYHKVKSGESLGTIAGKYRTTVREIQRINGLSSTKIIVGQRLKVKQGAAGTATKPKPTTTATKKYYTVRSGDTFGKIAQRHKKSMSQLKRLNPNINISRLSIGQKIRVK